MGNSNFDLQLTTTIDTTDARNGLEMLAQTNTQTATQIQEDNANIAQSTEGAQNAQNSLVEAFKALAQVASSIEKLLAGAGEALQAESTAANDAQNSTSQLTQETRDLSSAMREAQTDAQDLATTTSEVGEATQTSSAELSQAIQSVQNYTEALKSAANGIKDFITSGLELSQNLELTRERLENMLGASVNSREVLQQIKDTSRETGTSVQDLAQAAEILARNGQEVSKSLDLVNSLSTATGQSVDRAAEVMAKAFKGDAEAVKQLGEQFGITKQELEAAGAIMDKNGTIAASTANEQKALADALRQVIAVKYGDAIAKHGATMAGALEDFNSTLERLKLGVGEDFGGAVVAIVNSITKILKAIESLPEPARIAIEIFGGLTVAVGTLGAALPTLQGYWSNLMNAYGASAEILKSIATRWGAMTAAVEANTTALGLNSAASQTAAGSAGLYATLKARVVTYFGAMSTAIASTTALVFSFVAAIGGALIASQKFGELYDELKGLDKSATERMQDDAKTIRANKGTFQEFQQYRSRFGVGGNASSEETARALVERGASFSDLQDYAKAQRAYAMALGRQANEEDAGPRAKEQAREAMRQSSLITRTAEAFLDYYQKAKAKEAESAANQAKEQITTKKEDTTKSKETASLEKELAKLQKEYDKVTRRSASATVAEQRKSTATVKEELRQPKTDLKALADHFVRDAKKQAKKAPASTTQENNAPLSREKTRELVDGLEGATSKAKRAEVGAAFGLTPEMAEQYRHYAFWARNVGRDPYDPNLYKDAKQPTEATSSPNSVASSASAPIDTSATSTALDGLTAAAGNATAALAALASAALQGANSSGQNISNSITFNSSAIGGDVNTEQIARSAANIVEARTKRSEQFNSALTL